MALMMLQQPNFLVLDEPTNNLDIQSAEILEEFPGTFGDHLANLATSQKRKPRSAPAAGQDILTRVPKASVRTRTASRYPSISMCSSGVWSSSESPGP